jgi:hypothetical protein
MMSALPKLNIRGERGAALITAAVTLLLISVLAMTFMVTVRGERTMSSNVHVAKGSLYAADAGIRAAQQVMADTASARLARMLATYIANGSTGPLITAPGTFFNGAPMTLTSTNPNFSTSATIAWDDTTITPASQQFVYRLTVNSTGRQGDLGVRAVQSQGFLTVSASRGTFAQFLIFTNTHQMADGSDIWFTSSGFFDGRVHTNGKFRFAYKPEFTDLITSVNSRATYYNNSNPIDLNANNNGNIDVPTLGGGFNRSQANIALPSNTYNQENVALGPPLDPTSSTAPTNTLIRQALGMTGSTAPPDGVYLPTTSATSGVPNAGSASTGGIYIKGDLTSMTASVDGSGHQVYTMVQAGNTYTITLDRATNTTYYKKNTGSPVAVTGLPRGMIYTKGAINSLKGPARVSGDIPPAIADHTELLITATNDIVVTGDLTYNDYDNGNSVLGIYSGGGKVRIGTAAPDDMYLDAYVMATGTSGTLEVDNYDSGSPRGTFNLRGGMVAKYYGAFYTFRSDGTLRTGYARNFRYDRRGLTPPYYPTTPFLVPNQPSARTLAWKEM